MIQKELGIAATNGLRVDRPQWARRPWGGVAPWLRGPACLTHMLSRGAAEGSLSERALDPRPEGLSFQVLLAGAV